MFKKCPLKTFSRILLLTEVFRLDVYNVLSISLRIFRQIKRDRRTLGLMIMAPILVTFLFSWAFSGEITNVPVTICNEDIGLQEKVSDTIISVLKKNSNMSIVLDDADAFDKLGKEYHAVVILPKNLTKELVLTGTAKIQVYINVTTYFEAQILSAYLLNNISDALLSFLDVNRTDIEINQTVQLPFQKLPVSYFFNVCILNYDEGFDTIIGALIVKELEDDSDVALKIVNNSEDCYRDVLEEKSILGLVIPENFTRNILLHEEATLVSFINGVEKEEVLTAFKAIEDAIDEAVVSLFGEKAIEISKNYVYGSEEIAMIDFLAPSFLGFIATAFAFIISGILFLRERLLGTLERMLASSLTHSEIVLGYLLSFIVVTTIQSSLIVITTMLFSTQILKHFLLIYFIVLLLSIGSVSLSIFLSSYMKTELQVVQMIPIYIIPQLILSGLIIPLRSLPSILIPVAYVLPLTYYVDAVKRITLMNATIYDIWPQLTFLAAYFLLGIILGIKKFRREIA